MTKRRFIRELLIVLIIILCIPALSLAQEAGKSIKELKTEIEIVKDTEQRRTLFKSLSTLKPEKAEDVRELVEIAHASVNEIEKEVALSALKNIGKDDKHLESEFITLLDDSDREVRTAAIVNLGKLKTKAAAPKLREIVKDFGKVDHMKFKAMRAVDMKKAYKIIFEPGAAAMSLGEMKDEEAIPILVERFEELEEYAAIGLGRMGKKGLPYLLELARNEPERGNAYAHRALAAINDIEAKPDLLHILKTNKDRDIRMSVLDSLKRHMFDDEVLETVKSLYEKEKDIFFISAMKTKKAIPFLIHVLETSYDQNAREYTISILGKLEDPSAIPVLEEALQERNRNVRQLAARALKKITGKDYEWDK